MASRTLLRTSAIIVSLVAFSHAAPPAAPADPSLPAEAKSKPAVRKKTSGKSTAQLTSTYMPKVKAALGARWADAVTQHMSEFSPGSVDVTFKLDATGKVTDVAVTANTSNASFAKFCDQFLRETTFAAPPEGALADGQIEIPFTFTIH